MIPVDDLLTLLDVLAIDVQAVEDVALTDAALRDKARVAVEDWLVPRVEQAGFPARRHRTRRKPDAAWAYTGGTWTPLDDLVGTPTRISSLFVAPTDALFIGLDQPFRGLYVGMSDSVNPTACAASLSYWSGSWKTFGSSLTNMTVVGSTAFGQGGRVYWPMPTDWAQRPRLHPSDTGSPLYWLRLSTNSPAAGFIDQIVPISRSRLTHAVALQTLSLLYREGAARNRGEWLEKANAMRDAASEHLNLVLPQMADEFDLNVDGIASPTEVNSVTTSTRPWTWERG